MELKINKGTVTYVVPFYWGYYIDISHILNQGYRHTQQIIINALNELTGDNSWFIEDNVDEDLVWNMKENHVYGGSTKLGTSFLARVIHPKKLIEFKQSRFEITELLFFYHEFGVASCRLTVDFQSMDQLNIVEFDDITRDSDVVHQLMEFINAFIQIDCKVITEKLRENKIPISIDAKHFKELISTETIQAGFRKALWEHVIFEFKLNKVGAITEDDVDPYRHLINSSQITGGVDSSLDPNVRVYPGFGTSVILTTEDRDPEDTNLIRVLEIAEYYYAATSMLDDLLYDKFTTFSINRLSTTKIPIIQSDLNEIKTMSNLLEVFLFNLKDSLINFNPPAKLIWKTLEKEWYYGPMVDSLQEKSQILNEKYRDLLNELNEKRNETLNRFVKIFTVFAIIGPLFDFYNVLESFQVFEKLSKLNPIILISGIIVVLGALFGFGFFAISKIKKFY